MTVGSITAALTADHHRCDVYFDSAADAVTARRWDAAGQCLKDFARALGQHIRAEEEILFPAFETRTGNTAGPTRVMRREHEQFRALLGEMCNALENEDAEHYLSVAATLATSLQQHSAKEEQVLYPWADRVLAEERDELLRRMQALT
jgi:hemerythrin-like domain-containing protein